MDVGGRGGIGDVADFYGRGGAPSQSVVSSASMSCMSEQRLAMKRALSYVAKQRPPHWRVEMCNRNAGKGGYRVDWVGFDHCIRNTALRPSARSMKTMKR